jgi:hypothetical protein
MTKEKIVVFCWHCGLPSNNENVKMFVFDKELNKWFCSIKCLDTQYKR